MDDAEEKSGYMKFLDGQEAQRVFHLAERGGCGADVTDHCYYLTLTIPTMQAAGTSGVSNVMVEIGTALIPMICPNCGMPMFMKPKASPIAIARGMPPQ